MKQKKLKVFVITVSRNFPTTHKRKGEPTYFREKVLSGQCKQDDCNDKCSGRDINKFVIEFAKKIHTIRSNYPFWKKRIDQVQDGSAILSIRYWEGKPYNSKQVEIFKLIKDNDIGIQRLEFYEDKDGVPCIKYPLINNYSEPEISSIAKNDGLSLEDFKEWFRGYDLNKPMAIIHFTKFRY